MLVTEESLWWKWRHKGQGKMEDSINTVKHALSMRKTNPQQDGEKMLVILGYVDVVVGCRENGHGQEGPSATGGGCLQVCGPQLKPYLIHFGFWAPCWPQTLTHFDGGRDCLFLNFSFTLVISRVRWNKDLKENVHFHLLRGSVIWGPKENWTWISGRRNMTSRGTAEHYGLGVILLTSDMHQFQLNK